MDNLLDDFKNAWRRPNNALPQIIIINVVIFLVLAVLNIFGKIAGVEFISNFVYDQFSIPPAFADFIQRPWTLITYAFAHSLNSIFHILFNMLVLYWFGKLIVEYLGNQKLINLYVLGALAGGIIYLLVYNLIPYYIDRSNFPGMVGASAAVYAITLAAATLLPNYTFYLMFLGPVKIKYIAGFYILISFLGTVGGNAGGNIAHLGGAFIGYVYIKQLQSGTDWGLWIGGVMSFFKSLFTKQAPIKVSHKRAKTENRSATTSKTTSSTGHNIANQAEIDAILDKISQSGYESLSKEEKQKLFNASNKS
ncbi:rhomboid family intramembrane serine protease [Reichenbachiella agarivorans]|uniref:Rhomboid family intramembrane serine protease n=1 Tax=Reichenbachiella agarivorans TaxID=2979464 RepID=A0ABY6CPD6_9BACT|nr:rhomboid family intramembrane serine protease [Reichenbachiella agarivorans]UXP32394.1 rhomboid family intramembrane serine protease [Reichenbachiella agarivorans]